MSIKERNDNVNKQDNLKLELIDLKKLYSEIGDKLKNLKKTK